MMKITCCCFTCIIGEDKENQTEENRRLLKPEDEGVTSPITKEVPYSRSASAVSGSSTNRGLSTESGEPLSEPGDPPTLAKEKFSKAVSVLKKYNVVSSKYKTKELERQMSLPARLQIRVGLKRNTKNNTVKVSVIEATDIVPTLHKKGIPDFTASGDQEEAVVVQLRTKILHSEARAHTKKYEIFPSLSGALKFRGETIHIINFEEFLHSKIRFRFYCVMKHSRDKLLGEHTLDATTLDFDNTETPYVLLDLYDSAIAEFEVNSALSPGITSRVSSYESQTSIDNDARGSTTPKIQRQAKIRSQDSELRLSVKKTADKDIASPEKSGEDSTIKKAFKSFRGNSSKDRSPDSIETAAYAGEFDRLKMAVNERSEKVGELEKATVDMAESASNLSLLSVKLKEKYKGKIGKSKSSES